MLQLHSNISTTQIVDNKIYTREIPNTDLVVFRQIIETHVAGEVISSDIREGFTSISNLNSVQYGSFVEIKIPFKEAYNHTLYPVKISCENMKKVLNGEAHLMDKDIVEYKDYDIDTILNNEMFLMGTGREILYDRHYKLVVLPIYLDYVSGQLDNDHYNLDSAISILKNDPHVINRESIEIIDIPYYNADEYCNKTIELKYLPDADVYAKYLKIYQEEDSWKAARFILEDIIGLTYILK